MCTSTWVQHNMTHPVDYRRRKANSSRSLDQRWQTGGLINASDMRHYSFKEVLVLGCRLKDAISVPFFQTCDDVNVWDGRRLNLISVGAAGGCVQAAGWFVLLKLNENIWVINIYSSTLEHMNITGWRIKLDVVQHWTAATKCSCIDVNHQTDNIFQHETEKHDHSLIRDHKKCLNLIPLIFVDASQKQTTEEP